MHDALGDRMKTNYENVTRSFLVRRMPVIIRLDGKAFHTLTRNCKKPWDDEFSRYMEDVAKKLCDEVQNVKIAYVQSDEISLLLTDYENLGTQQWFDGNIQKMCSVSAAIASVEFSKFKEAYFDSRVFNIPKEEVCNYFIWRQNDAVRNSINSLAQAHFSHKELHNLNINEVQEKLFSEKGINWDKEEIWNKRGRCVKKFEKVTCEIPQETVEGVGKYIIRTFWSVDYAIPEFTKDRFYIERLI